MRGASFRTSAFNTSEVRPYFINDCCFGDDLARWMISRLRAAGLDTDPEPGQEDFGWYFGFTVADEKHCCVLGFQEDDPEGIWHLWLERSRGLLGSLFGRRSRGISEAAASAIEAVLLEIPGLRNLELETKSA